MRSGGRESRLKMSSYFFKFEELYNNSSNCDNSNEDSFDVCFIIMTISCLLAGSSWLVV